MSKVTSLAKDRVSMGQKIAFGIGMFANQMFPAILGIFMVVLVQDLGFPGWMWGILFFLPRVFDSITDPIMGFISDNTKSKWGRRRHYVFLGALIMGVSFVIMWQLYRENGVDYNFTYFLLWSFVFYLGLTIFSVPYVAMGYEMSNDFHERTEIMAIAQWIGQWAWVIAPWFWVFMYDSSWFESADIATRELAIWVGLACMLCAMVPAIFINSKPTLNEDYSPLNFSTIGGSLKKIIIGFGEAFKSKPFRQLCVATFFIYNTFYTIASFSFFIVVYYLFGGDAGAAGIWPTLFGSVGALATTFIVIPIITKMSKKLGKKKAFIISQAISILGYILLWFLFIPGKPYMFLFALPFFSFGIGSLFTLMMSMTADVIDLDELNTGQRREGVFGAIYWWMVKFGFAIAGLLTGTIMSVVGFDPNEAVQPEGAIFGLRAFYSGFPIVGTLIAIYVMWKYDLTEERANEISRKLESKKSKTTGGYERMAGLSTIDFNNISEKGFREKFPEFFTTKLDFEKVTKQALELEFDLLFKTGMHGICFSAYAKGQGPGDYLPEEQIRKRLLALKGHTQWIRVFSCTSGHEKIPIIAKEMGFKTMVGSWIDNDLTKNQAEIQALISLVNGGYVNMASVGNEVLFRNELSEKELLRYISNVKNQTSNIPIGYVDTYHEFINRPLLIDACDLILANCYPFWEGVNIRMAGFQLQEMYRQTKAVANGKEVIITETGWPSAGQKVNQAIPSKRNMQEYFVKTQLWAKNEGVGLFYFSSFDESWKIHAEGWAGTSWGLWNSQEEFKH